MSIGLYIYGVVPATTVGLSEIAGLDGSPVYLISRGNLSIVVHDCREVLTPRDEAHLTELVLAHSAVVETIWDWAGTILPVSFGTIVQGTGDATAEANVWSWLDAHQAGMSDTLRKFVGKVELGIQIFWEPVIAERLAEADPQVRELRGRIDGMSPGAAYLFRQKLERMVRHIMEEYRANLCRDYLQRFQSHIVDFRHNQLKQVSTGTMLMNMAVLVRKEAEACLGEELAAINREEGTRVRFTGPWPPYSFIPPVYSAVENKAKPDEG